MQQKSYTNVTISQLRSSCNAKTKNKDGFFVYWSIAPALRRRDEDAVFRRERLYNKPILDNVLRDDRYAELKALCESREYPAYTAAAVFCRSLRQSMTEITPEIPQLQFLPIIDKLTEQEQALTAQIDRLLSGAAGVPPRKLLYLYNRIFRKASQIADLRKKVEEGAVRYIRAVIMHIGSALDAALEAAGAVDTLRLPWECVRPKVVVTAVAFYDRPQTLLLADMYGKNLTFCIGGMDGCDCARSDRARSTPCRSLRTAFH